MHTPLCWCRCLGRRQTQIAGRSPAPGANQGYLLSPPHEPAHLEGSTSRPQGYICMEEKMSFRVNQIVLKHGRPDIRRVWIQRRRSLAGMASWVPCQAGGWCNAQRPERFSLQSNSRRRRSTTISEMTRGHTRMVLRSNVRTEKHHNTLTHWLFLLSQRRTPGELCSRDTQYPVRNEMGHGAFGSEGA